MADRLVRILTVKQHVIHSGYSVSLSADGTTVAIGARMEMMVMGMDSGHVRVYHLDDSGSSLSWVQVGNDIDGVAVGDESGYSVSLSADGKSVAVGSRDNDDNGSNAGHARVFMTCNPDISPSQSPKTSNPTKSPILSPMTSSPTASCMIPTLISPSISFSPTHF